MRINWRVRFRNRAFWIAIIPAVLMLIQVIAAMFNVSLDPTEASNKLIAIVDAAFAVLAILGVVVDPTTEGIGDSKRAMSYTEPKKKEDE